MPNNLTGVPEKVRQLMDAKTSLQGSSKNT